jgi:acyl carrier protein
MELNAIIQQVNDIFIDLFQDNTIVIDENTTNADVAAWDSLNHIQVITAIESKFNIYFEINELLNFTNIGDLCKCVQLKLN